MIILENAPIKFDLNTHGGFSLKFDNFQISQDIGQKWRVMMKGWGTVADNRFDSLLDAYHWAIVICNSLEGKNSGWFRDGSDGETKLIEIS